jgi:hypothetical protein
MGTNPRRNAQGQPSLWCRVAVRSVRLGRDVGAGADVRGVQTAGIDFSTVRRGD